MRLNLSRVIPGRGCVVGGVGCACVVLPCNAVDDAGRRIGAGGREVWGIVRSWKLVLLTWWVARGERGSWRLVWSCKDQLGSLNTSQRPRVNQSREGMVKC